MNKTHAPDSLVDDRQVNLREAVGTVRRALSIAMALDPTPHHGTAEKELVAVSRLLNDAWGTSPAACPRFRVILFHYPLPPDALAYRSGDLRMDLSETNFEWVIERTIRNLLGTLQDCEVVFITDHTFLKELHFDRLRILRLDLDPHTPMFNRVALYCAYIHSKHFTTRTALLDSDVFVLRSFDSLFQMDFDVAVSFRSAANLMSVNEGVILVCPQRIETVRKWFFRYLQNYCMLAASPEMHAIYPSIKRWRGGQLSLNALCGGQLFYQAKLEYIRNTRTAFLPCTLVNRALDPSAEGNTDYLRTCFAIHLKGALKKDLAVLDQLLSIQRLKLSI